MGRAPTQQIEQAAQALLSDGERVTATGTCWAVQLRRRVPLLFLARHKYVVALTTRRTLVFARRRGGPDSSDLVIAKRYETFAIQRVRRRRPLLQIIVISSNGNRLAFEFPRRRRELAGRLIARLTPPPGAAERRTPAAPVGAAPEPVIPVTPPSATIDAAPPPVAPPPNAGPPDAAEDEAFWGAPK